MSTTETEGPQRISVSLDALRTEIRAANGELELRLRDYIDNGLGAIRTETSRQDAERDKRLDERSLASKEAVTVAMSAQKEGIAVALAERDKALNAALLERDKAIDKAEKAARETMQAHNDLIRQSRDRDSTYATQTDLGHISDNVARLASFQAKIIGAVGLLMVVMPVISGVVVFLVSKP